MTKAEASKVIGILLNVDNECIVCAGNACEDLIGLFPDHEDITRVMFEARYDQPFRTYAERTATE